MLPVFRSNAKATHARSYHCIKVSNLGQMLLRTERARQTNIRPCVFAIVFHTFRQDHCNIPDVMAET